MLFVIGVTAFLVSVALVPFSATTAVAQEKAEGVVVKDKVSQEKKARGEYELGTMTVTAQKQKENVQDVPVSITVFGEQDIEDKKIESVWEIADFVPNLMFFDTGMSSMVSQPTMRGISASGMSFTTSVGLYVDGVPTLSSYGFEEGILDIERIEVLRGPQGTLYGKNTETGVINIITRKPDNTFRGKVSAQGGKLLSGETDDKQKGEFSLNMSGPILKDKLFLGIAGQYYKKDGFVENTVTGDAEDDRERWFGRAHLRCTPADDLEMSLIVSRFNHNDGGSSMNLGEKGAAMFWLPVPPDRKVSSNDIGHRQKGDHFRCSG
jgi:iron complex outermembrane receptor protein